MLQASAVALEFEYDVEHHAGIAVLQRSRGSAQRIKREQTKQLANVLGFERCAAAGNRLVEGRQRIAHRTFARLREHGQGFFFGRDALFAADPTHAVDEFVEVHAAEAELLAARGDGHRDLVRFRRTENKDDPLGRLFERLEERVESLVRNLMGFVDDENFVAVAGRAEANVLAQFAHFVDAAIGGRVDFDDVHRAALRDLEAAGALAAGRNGRTFGAIQAARENTGDRGFAGSALAGEDVTVRDAPLGNGVFDRRANVFLADQFGERLRTILAGDYLVRLGGGGGRRRGGHRVLRICQTPGDPRHTSNTATVASFRTWRGLRLSVARSPEPDKSLE